MSSSHIPRDNSIYNSVDYWDKRYESCGQSESQSYDWLVDYSNVKHIIQKNVSKTAFILMLGCGNSLLSEEMFADGYQHIHNIDYSSPVIKQMSTHCDKCSQMKWSVMNCLNLQFSDDSFDVVLEKATIDALLTEEKSPWNISQGGIITLSSVLKEVYRVLKSGGQFLSISFIEPHLRFPFYKKCLNYCSQNQELRLRLKDIHILGNNFHYFCYQFIKSQDKTIEYEPAQYIPPTKTLINQSSHNSDRYAGANPHHNYNCSDDNSKVETRAQVNHCYLFDINL